MTKELEELIKAKTDAEIKLSDAKDAILKYKREHAAEEYNLQKGKFYKIEDSCSKIYFKYKEGDGIRPDGDTLIVHNVLTEYEYRIGTNYKYEDSACYCNLDILASRLIEVTEEEFKEVVQRAIKHFESCCFGIFEVNFKYN